MSTRALVIEPSQILRNSLSPFFQGSGLDLYGAASLEDARALLLALKPQVTIVDREFGDGDGLELVAEAVGAGARAVVVSARNEAADRIRALTLGAHEYLAKPADPEEVYLRVRNLLAAQAVASDDRGVVRDFGGARVDLVTRAVLRPDGSRGDELTESELAILRTLAESVDQIVSREALRLAATGGEAQDKPTRAIDTCVSRLRVKLRAADAAVEIRSVRQAGYLLRRQRAGKGG
jgi:two-component system OmpR family response regulator